jgi:hypothetical protein
MERRKIYWKRLITRARFKRRKTSGCFSDRLKKARMLWKTSGLNYSTDFAAALRPKNVQKMDGGRLRNRFIQLSRFCNDPQIYLKVWR